MIDSNYSPVWRLVAWIPGADPASKFRGGDSSNIWHSILITGSLL